METAQRLVGVLFNGLLAAVVAWALFTALASAPEPLRGLEHWLDARLSATPGTPEARLEGQQSQTEVAVIPAATVLEALPTAPITVPVTRAEPAQALPWLLRLPVNLNPSARRTPAETTNRARLGETAPAGVALIACIILVDGYGTATYRRVFLEGRAVRCTASDGRILAGEPRLHAVDDAGLAGLPAAQTQLSGAELRARLVGASRYLRDNQPLLSALAALLDAETRLGRSAEQFSNQGVLDALEVPIATIRLRLDADLALFDLDGLASGTSGGDDRIAATLVAAQEPMGPR